MEGGGDGDVADATAVSLHPWPTWSLSLLRPRPNNVNDKADKAATMQLPAMSL